MRAVRTGRAAPLETRRGPRAASPSAARGRRPSDRMRRMTITGCGVRIAATAHRAAVAPRMQPPGTRTRMRVPIQVLAGAWTAAGRPATNGRALRPGETAGRARRQ
ncbi:hypothetical protein [Burkholderia pseudomallei]|uniref:hypothetical protein n=1 Tax=Burkholderia pseudomallei TaxID=28450 RepID=UPI0023618798|nr:hypothetical protein [Burkholderia pseudomallei]